jgi:hypothetical protein
MYRRVIPVEDCLFHIQVTPSKTVQKVVSDFISAKTSQRRTICCDYSFNKAFYVLAGSIHPSGAGDSRHQREQQVVNMFVRLVP